MSNTVKLPKKLFKILWEEACKVDDARRLHKKQMVDTVKKSLNVQNRFGFVCIPYNPYWGEVEEPEDKVLMTYLRFQEHIKQEWAHLNRYKDKRAPTKDELTRMWGTSCFNMLSADDKRCAKYAYGSNVHKYFC